MADIKLFTETLNEFTESQRSAFNNISSVKMYSMDEDYNAADMALAEVMVEALENFSEEDLKEANSGLILSRKLSRRPC